MLRNQIFFRSCSSLHSKVVLSVHNTTFAMTAKWSKGFWYNRLRRLIGREIALDLGLGIATASPRQIPPMPQLPCMLETYFGSEHFPPTQDSETLHGPSVGQFKMVPEKKKNHISSLRTHCLKIEILKSFYPFQIQFLGKL